MIISTDALEINAGSDEKANKLKFLSEQIEKIYILKFSPKNSSSQELKSFLEKFNRIVKEKRYEELFSFKMDEGAIITAYIVKGHGKKIKEFVFIKKDKSEVDSKEKTIKTDIFGEDIRTEDEKTKQQEFINKMNKEKGIE